MRKQLDVQTNRDTRLTTLRIQGFLLAGITVVLLGWAGSAQASDEFEAGFEYELGRVTAHHLAFMSHLFFFGFHPQPVVVHQHHPGCGHRPYRVHPRRHLRHHDRYDRQHHDERLHGQRRRYDGHARPGGSSYRGRRERDVRRRS